MKQVQKQRQRQRKAVEDEPAPVSTNERSKRVTDAAEEFLRETEESG